MSFRLRDWPPKCTIDGDGIQPLGWSGFPVALPLKGVGQKMKIRIATSSLLLAFLFSALTLPGFAQQSNTTAPPATSTTNDRVLEPLPPQTATDFWDGDDPNLVSLVTHPFASKKYVQRMTRPIKDRLNELDEITSNNATAIKDVDA